MTPLRTVVLAEQSLIRSLLVVYLRSSRRALVVGDAGGSCRGLALCQQLSPNLVIVDTQMPRIGGRELAAHLAEIRPAPLMIALIDHHDHHSVTRVMENGFVACIGKDASLDSLIEALEAVQRGDRYFSREFHEAAEALKADPGSYPKVLSDREQEVLSHVASGLTSQAIANHLGLSRRTVETHRHNIIKKMDLRDMADLVRFAVERGFRSKDCGPSPSGPGAHPNCGCAQRSATERAATWS
jgi:DNA-binding NarL/FixJ family response regulator